MKKKVDIRRKKIARQAEKNQQSVVQNSLIASELAVKEESIPRIDELEGLETIAVLPGKISTFLRNHRHLTLFERIREVFEPREMPA